MVCVHVTVRHNLQPGSNGAPVAAGGAAAATADEAAESDDELEGGSSATWSPERRTAEDLVGSITWQHGAGCTAPSTAVCCIRHPGQPLDAREPLHTFSCHGRRWNAGSTALHSGISCLKSARRQTVT